MSRSAESVLGGQTVGIESISGLPAHVLLVHAPVVLMPMALLLTLVLAVKPSWRRRSGFLPPVAAAVVFVATFLAIRSGQAFDEIIGDRVDTTDHEDLANATLLFVGGFTIASAVMAVVDRWRDRDGPSWLAPVAPMAVIATVGLAAIATFLMIQTGDEGATLVWKGVISD